jgi:2-iminobutanoate/2-iminopropanoate deaminase
VVGGIAYVAGMTASGGDLGDEYTQSKAIFGKIKHLIEAAGGTMADIVTVTIFVTDISQREKVWQARREFLPAISRALGCFKWPHSPIRRSRSKSTP